MTPFRVFARSSRLEAEFCMIFTESPVEFGLVEPELGRLVMVHAMLSRRMTEQELPHAADDLRGHRQTSELAHRDRRCYRVGDQPVVAQVEHVELGPVRPGGR